MTEFAYPALVASPRTGAEPFHAGGSPAGFDLTSFWRWAASDVAGNTLRGVLAEYLVARAIEAPLAVRTEWDACDLRSAAGVRVEVKSAAYFQSWGQKAPSKIHFDIAPKRGWDAATNASAPVPCRTADVYVFALLAHQDKATLDPLDLGQWQFYVVPSRTLDAACRAQKKIALKPLSRLAGPPVGFDRLGAMVAQATSS